MASIDVCPKIAFLIGPVRTEGARVRLFSCMDTHVSSEFGPVSKQFATDCTWPRWCLWFWVGRGEGLSSIWACTYHGTLPLQNRSVSLWFQQELHDFEARQSILHSMNLSQERTQILEIQFWRNQLMILPLHPHSGRRTSTLHAWRVCASASCFFG